MRDHGPARGREIVWIASIHQLAHPLEARGRAVAGHHADDRGEVVVELGEASPEPEGGLGRLGARDPIAAEDEDHRSRPVMLCSGGEKERLVGGAENGHQDDDGNELLEADRRRDQRANHRSETRRIEQDVEPGAPRPAEKRQARKERQLGRAGPEEIEEASNRRKIAAGEGPAAAAETEDLEEHAPEDGFLEADRLEPPRRSAANRLHSWREAAEERPAPGIERELERIDGIDAERGAVALERPGAADHAALFGKRLLRPRQRVVGRSDWIEEAHAQLPRYVEYP